MRVTDVATLTNAVAALAERAGRAILDVYDDPASFGVETKDDGSPLTRADLASHRILVAGLRELTPEVPILSEESAEVPYEERASWSRYWLVDPLDGTKEFLKRNGEFTVNVALIEVEDGVGAPVAGVVHVPATGATYGGARGHGAWRAADGERTDIAPASAASVPQIVLKLDVYAETQGAAGGGFLPRDKTFLEYQMEDHLAFGAEHEVPMSVMEFGAVRQAFQMEGKGGEQWVGDMLSLLEENNLSFSYWEYHGTEMGLYLSGSGEPGEPNTALQEVLRRELGGEGG